MTVQTLATRPHFATGATSGAGSSATALLATTLLLMRLQDVRATLAATSPGVGPHLIHGGPGTGTRLAMGPPVPPLFGPREGPAQGLRPTPAPAPGPPPPPAPPTPPVPPPPPIPAPAAGLPPPTLKELAGPNLTGGPGAGGPNPLVAEQQAARSLRALQQARTPGGARFAPTPTLNGLDIVTPHAQPELPPFQSAQGTGQARVFNPFPVEAGQATPLNSPQSPGGMQSANMQLRPGVSVLPQPTAVEWGVIFLRALFQTSPPALFRLESHGGDYGPTYGKFRPLTYEDIRAKEAAGGYQLSPAQPGVVYLRITDPDYVQKRNRLLIDEAKRMTETVGPPRDC